VIWREDVLSEAKVSQLQHFVRDKDILWFDISVNNSMSDQLHIASTDLLK
jgi:hypothetical protein